MLISMTGFSRVYRDEPWGTLTVEMSSVNSRYLEVFVRSCRELISEEPMIQSALRHRLSRGKVQVRVELTWASHFKMGRINSKVLESYSKQLNEISSSMGDDRSIPLENLINLPGVTESASLIATVNEKVSPVLKELVNEGIDGLQSMRELEGERLLGDIVLQLSDYEKVIAKIDGLWKKSSERALDGLKERLESVMEKFCCSVDEARIAQELIILSDKWDISEEISRTYSHIGQFKKLIDQTGARGRKLDFLLQEMNREINTMGSKVGDSEIRWLVVDGKAFLERIREQIQNVE